MKIKLIKFHNIKYLVPEEFEFLNLPIQRYPSFCGAGKGIGDLIVPETIGGMKCSHICHVHDESFYLCSPTYAGFTKSNIMFAFNLAVYLSSKKSGFFKTSWRLVKGCVYVIAVSTFGWKFFKSLKKG